MPRRKRTSGDGGRRPKVCRVESSEETLVISDSEHEEEEECSANRSSRTVRWSRRGCKSQIQEMTEDEMLNLAMKLSAQEANSAAQRRQLEDSDIQKAIAESLNVCDEDDSVEASSSSAQPQQSVSDVISRLRRKLSYPNQNEVHGARKSLAAQADVPEMESTSPLPEMPDLSQATHSPSSSSSAQVCEPPVASQDSTPDIQPIIKDSQEDEFSRTVSPSQPSPAFPKHSSFIRQPLVCVEKLSQDLINSSTGLKEQLCTQDSVVGPSSTSQTQEDSSFSKSHVSNQNDFRGETDLLEDEHDPCEENECITQIPDEDLPAHQDECSSPSRRSQTSKTIREPEKADANVTVRSETPDLKQVKGQITQDENSAPDAAESAPNADSWYGFSSHMVVLLTDDEDGSEEVLSPSPVLHDETALKKVTPIQPCVASSTLDSSKQDTQISQHALQEESKTPKDLKCSDSKPLYSGVEKEQCTVSYYWGVPFCPTGQNPDDYTRVIMCQLEVYEKSLKEARRELLRKAEWSQPVLPSSERPFGPRRLKRYRPPQLSEDEEQNEEETEKKRTEVQEERKKHMEESVAGSEKAAEGGQSETYVVLSSPEAKDEDVQKSNFPSQDKTTTTPLRKDQWDASDNTQIERTDEVEETQNQDQFDDEETVCPETQLTDNNTPELMMTSPASPEQAQSRAGSEVMEVDDERGAPAAEEEMMEQECASADTAPPETQVECPMCSKLFSLDRIEMHAAFCDGETEDQNQEEQSQVVRKTRSRRDPAEETQHRPENRIAQTEKCFLCQRMFSSHQYSAHVDVCLKKTDSNINQGDGLISALERTEQIPAGSDEAGPSDVSSKSNRGHADLSGQDWCKSEDTEQLTDLQQQDSSKNSQRLARKRKFKR